MAMVVVKYAPEFFLAKDTLYLALMSEFWGVFCEDLDNIWPCYNGTALYCN